MGYYVYVHRDKRGQRKVTLVTKEWGNIKTGKRESHFTKGHFYWVLPTTRQVYLAYMRGLKEMVAIADGYPRDFRGIRYEEFAVLTEDGPDIDMRYIFNRHQRKQKALYY